MTVIGKSTVPRDCSLDALLGRGVVPSFSELVALAGGEHPSELLRRLMNYHSTDLVLLERAGCLLTEAKTLVQGNGHPQGAGLALPHPIDAEWRFTDRTADDLLAAAVEVTQPGDAILLMGVPSVVLAALRSDYDRYFAMFGENNIITDGLRNLTAGDARLDHGLVEGQLCAAAILDPPWYLDKFCGMLGVASQWLEIGGHLFVSAPSDGVRPSIPEDLRLIGEAATKCGLTFVSQDVAALTYRTPLFELNALRASGVGAWLPEWRRGNLAVYRKNSDTADEFSIEPDYPGFELTLAGVRLRLLQAKLSDPSVELVPIYEGEIFPSVSMRAPRRSEATLWTSGNRAFSVGYSAGLAALIAISNERGVWPKGLDRELSLSRNMRAIDGVQPLIQKLVGLADREFAEAANVLGPTAWETAANDARFLSGSRIVSR